MKSAQNPELDDILLNLMNSREYKKPRWKTALKYRELKASTGLQLKQSHKSSNSLLNLSRYQKYGTGVTLYFNILQFLIITFIILSINSLPSLLCNLKGNGLDIYTDGAFTNSLMRLSLANQNQLNLNDLLQSPNNLLDMKVSQGIVIFCDILSSIIFLCFLIYWQIKSDRLITELLSENVFPSYYTLMITKLPKNYKQEAMKEHFQKFGQVADICTVYDLSNVIQRIQQFIKLVDEYAIANQANREFLYNALQQIYLKIKSSFNSSDRQIKPNCVFVTFNHINVRNQVYRLYQQGVIYDELRYQSQVLQVDRCKVEPSSIIWQNFHLKQHVQRRKSFLIYGLLFLVLVTALISFFLMHAHSTRLKQIEVIHIDQKKNYTYEQVLKNDSKDILFNFCSKIDPFSFEWKYYVLCIPYYQSYQQKIVAMMTLSLLIVAINYILSLIIFALGFFRRYKTKTEEGSFLIVNIFIVYFINTGLLILLLRADFDGYSLSNFMKTILPKNTGILNIEVYKDFNRKWYLHIGSQIIVNYAVSLIISPFFQILIGWINKRLKFFLARWCKTQKQMNQLLVGNEFDFQTYYAMLLNSVFYCLFYVNAIPILYIFGIFSILSLYIASIIIFKYFSCQPPMFDHTLNKLISKLLIIALLLHQLTSIVFYYVDDIFPYQGDHQYSLIHKFSDGVVYILIIIVLLLFLVFHDHILKRVKVYWNKKFKEKISKEQIKSESSLEFFRLFKKKKNTYLSSYHMEDNPIYYNLSYTLSVFKIIINKSIQNNQIESQPQLAEQKQENDDEIYDYQIKQSSKYKDKIGLL